MRRQWWGGEDEDNFFLFSFSLSTATYNLLKREEWERVSKKTLMEDLNKMLVGEIACGLGVGGLNRALVEPYIKFRPEVNVLLIRLNLT